MDITIKSSTLDEKAIEIVREVMRNVYKFFGEKRNQAVICRAELNDAPSLNTAGKKLLLGDAHWEGLIFVSYPVLLVPKTLRVLDDFFNPNIHRDFGQRLDGLVAVHIAKSYSTRHQSFLVNHSGTETSLQANDEMNSFISLKSVLSSVR